ncbi:YtcA family lipoprotein [Castellaniella sp.]|uniref:YtcA family lipoprotein n=1 Tax=Castellaniella sp. TaxID=1955812 RepID=UPI00355CE53D
MPKPYALLLALLCTGCGPRAPSFLFLGSYFPSWLFGIAAGTIATVLLRLALIRVGIDDALPLRLLVYTGLAVIFAMMFAFTFSPR